VAIKKSDLYSSLWASCDELRGGGFLRRRQLARPVTATRAGADLAGAATPTKLSMGQGD
jgi:hypothetical protein